MIISNRKTTYLWLLLFLIAFILYLLDAPVAMAASQPLAETAAESPSEEITADLDAERSSESDAEQSSELNAEQSPEPDTEPDTVSTADEFKEWLESHKNCGGSVKLTNDIILREFYEFTLGGAQRPDVVVDTNGHTITASGKISFVSDGHLIFRGQTGSNCIFWVTKGDVLTLDGVIVEGDADTSARQYAVWQEEGSGLIIGATFTESQVSGNIHYADIPFVMYPDTACVVVEKGQTVDNLLPAEIKGDVIFKGQIQARQVVPITWDLTGTETQQEKRQRFRIKGFSSQVVYDVEPVCTVVYNDYPLTFTDMDAYIRANAYYFQGGYTKPKEELPMMVASEYSFDGTNWIIGKEEMVATDKADFRVYFPCNQWDTDQNPYIYLRLRGEKGDKKYYSNILRYEAHNMEAGEDLGGNRGGGTSIVNPPEEPEEDITNTPSSDYKPSSDHKPSGDHKEEGTYTADDSQTEAADALLDAAGNDSNVPAVPAAAAPETGVLDNPTAPEPITNPADDGAVDAVPNTEPVENRNSHSSTNETDADVVRTETKDVMSRELAASAHEETTGDSDTHQKMTVRQKIDTTRKFVLISGFVTLSAGIGVAAYFVHAGRSRRRKRRRTASFKTGGRKKTT